MRIKITFSSSKPNYRSQLTCNSGQILNRCCSFQNSLRIFSSDKILQSPSHVLLEVDEMMSLAVNGGTNLVRAVGCQRNLFNFVVHFGEDVYLLKNCLLHMWKITVAFLPPLDIYKFSDVCILLNSLASQRTKMT